MFSLKVFLFYQFYLPACSWPLLLQLFPQQRQHRKGMRCWQFPFSPNLLFCWSKQCISIFVWVLIVLFVLQNRAQAATELLQELNSDVSGNFVEEVGVASLPRQSWLSVITWQHDYTHKKNYQNEFHVTYHYGCIQLFLFKCVAQLFCFQLKIMRS